MALTLTVAARAGAVGDQALPATLADRGSVASQVQRAGSRRSGAAAGKAASLPNCNTPALNRSTAAIKIGARKQDHAASRLVEADIARQTAIHRAAFGIDGDR